MGDLYPSVIYWPICSEGHVTLYQSRPVWVWSTVYCVSCGRPVAVKGFEQATIWRVL